MRADDVRSRVRALHNAVARRDDVTASTRPAGTTTKDLERMVRDVVRKLEVDDRTSVCELGAGTGVLAVPLARRSRSFVGVDFADEAVAVLAERFTAAGLDGVAEAVLMDVLEAPDSALAALGEFDRVLVYAALHYVESPAEADRFVSTALSLVAPGGRALFGNLPVDGRPLRRDLRWSGAALAFRVWRKLRRLARSRAARAARAAAGESPSVPGTSALRVDRLQAIVERHGMVWHWRRPGIGVPLFTKRLDLVVRRP